MYTNDAAILEYDAIWEQIITTEQWEKILFIIREIDEERFCDCLAKITLRTNGVPRKKLLAVTQQLIEENVIVGLNIGNALKRPINDRIRATCILMGSGRFFVARHCVHTIDALKNAVWDAKHPTEDVRLDDGTTNIDSLDAMEYALEREIPALIDRWGR